MKQINQAWGGVPCAGPDCERVLRSKTFDGEGAEGMFPRQGRGMYKRCYQRSRTTPKPEPILVLPEDVAAFIEDRRRRGIPAEGLRWAA